MIINEKKRILFVDDEQSLLQGLKRLLRKKSREWDMIFAHSGEEALQRFQESAFDIIVSDLRMPGMNGAELLCQVQKRYPDTARFILSGYADSDLILQTVGVAHQFLSKPCSSVELMDSLSRAFALRDIFFKDSLLSLIRKASSIPTLPDVFTDLTEALRKPNVSAEEISHIIETDITISAKVLQLVNSSFFSMGQNVASVATAVSLLGITMIKSIVIMAGVFNVYDEATVKKYKIREIYSHSLSLSRTAGNLMGKLSTDRKLIERAMLAGMMHDLGKLTIINGDPFAWEEVCEREQRTEQPQHEIEQDVLGITHAEISAYMLGLWGLPNPVMEAVAYHHFPSRSLDQSLGTTAVLHIADVCDREEHSGRSLCNEYDRPFLERIGVWDRLAEFETYCKEGDMPRGLPVSDSGATPASEQESGC